jgi:hypothetical protein
LPQTTIRCQEVKHNEQHAISLASVAGAVAPLPACVHAQPIPDSGLLASIFAVDASKTSSFTNESLGYDCPEGGK